MKILEIIKILNPFAFMGIGFKSGIDYEQKRQKKKTDKLIKKINREYRNR